jgi:hypothetical protein
MNNVMTYEVLWESFKAKKFHVMPQNGLGRFQTLIFLSKKMDIDEKQYNDPIQVNI